MVSVAAQTSRQSEHAVDDDVRLATKAPPTGVGSVECMQRSSVRSSLQASMVASQLTDESFGIRIVLLAPRSGAHAVFSLQPRSFWRCCSVRDFRTVAG